MFFLDIDIKSKLTKKSILFESLTKYANIMLYYLMFQKI